MLTIVGVPAPMLIWNQNILMEYEIEPDFWPQLAIARTGIDRSGVHALPCS